MSKQKATNASTLSIELITPHSLDNRPIYITGNFNKWLPDLPQFQLTNIAPGKYLYQFPRNLELPDILEYKYTRGAWDQAELSSYGENVTNRSLSSDVKWTIDTVPLWQSPDNSTSFEPIVEEIAELISFDASLLPRSIQVLLPYNYYIDAARRYPVLYLTNHSQEKWPLQEELADLCRKHDYQLIIVIVDTLTSEVYHELSPYDHPTIGKGKGQEMLRFIVRHLKPFIDQKYRTYSNRLSTGIGGNQLGGLLTLYAGVMHPETFGKLLLLSPSLTIANRIVYDIEHFFEPFEYKAYFYAQKSDGSEMIANIKTLLHLIRRRSYGYEKRMKSQLSFNKEENQLPQNLGPELNKAIQWLFFEN